MPKFLIKSMREYWGFRLDYWLVIRKDSCSSSTKFYYYLIYFRSPFQKSHLRFETNFRLGFGLLKQVYKVSQAMGLPQRAQNRSHSSWRRLKHQILRPVIKLYWTLQLDLVVNLLHQKCCLVVLHSYSFVWLSSLWKWCSGGPSCAWKASQLDETHGHSLDSRI